LQLAVLSYKSYAAVDEFGRIWKFVTSFSNQAHIPVYRVSTLHTAVIVGWRTCESAYCTKWRPIVSIFVHYIRTIHSRLCCNLYLQHQFSPAFDDTVSLALAGKDNFFALVWRKWTAQHLGVI